MAEAFCYAYAMGVWRKSAATPMLSLWRRVRQNRAATGRILFKNNNNDTRDFGTGPSYVI
eukprot:4461971-Heterocapsa_arctica.AAC.1